MSTTYLASYGIIDKTSTCSWQNFTTIISYIFEILYGMKKVHMQFNYTVLWLVAEL